MHFSNLCKESKKRHNAVSMENTLNCTCRFLYIVGIQSVRILKRIKRKADTFLRPLGYLIRHIYSISLGRQIQHLQKDWTAFQCCFNSLAYQLKRIKGSSARSIFSVLFHSFHVDSPVHKKIVSTVLNIAVPAISVLALILTAQYWSRMNFSLIFSNHGKQLAAIQDEKVYEQATEMVSKRMVHDADQPGCDLSFAPGFQLTMGNSNLQKADAVCNLLIRQSNGIIENASGLYADGQLMGAVKSSADLRYLLNNLLETAKGNSKNTMVSFVKNIEVINGLYPTASLISTEEMDKLINGNSKAGTTYVVKQGDTATSIAAARHTTVAELKKINPGLGDSLHPGDLIQLQIAVPNLEVELIRSVTYDAVIPYTTVIQKDTAKYSDYSEVLTQGVNGKQRCTDLVRTVNGIEIKRDSISRQVLAKPVNKVVLTGTKKRPVNKKGVASGKFMWPVPSLHTITTYFAWRWGTFHKGIDISGSGAYGSTIVASDGGVVSLADWNDGYGKCVIIDHGNGKKTLYGHCSSLLVQNGEAVSKGQPIALVGSTGDSTGPHCHFEVIVNDAKVNPLSYVS